MMSELHQMQDLKLNLKFEVEVLCNTLTLDLKVRAASLDLSLKSSSHFIIFDLFIIVSS